MTTGAVPLVRCFTPVPRSIEEAGELEASMAWGGRQGACWLDLLDERLCVILADAGAGKTHEIRLQATHLRKGGREAFFLRIEDLDADFPDAFEVGTAADFAAWLDGTSEGWFYLDSVDEARLTSPRYFEQALRRFERKIRAAKARAHVTITSRPYAWRFKADALLVRELFGGSAEKQVEEIGEDSDPALPDGDAVAAMMGGEERHVVATDDQTPKLFWLSPLDNDDIRLFAGHRGVADCDQMLAEIERAAIAPLVAKPFDLEGVIAQWQQTQQLGGRTTVLQHLIASRLDEQDPDRRGRQPIKPDRAREGARLLAFAVTMTGSPGIRVPDQDADRTGLDAAALLGWDAAETDALLSRALFDDAIFGMVRFRHRDIRELLAAEYLVARLAAGAPRQAIERLFFDELTACR